MKSYIGPLTDPVTAFLYRHDRLSRATRQAVVTEAKAEIEAYRRDFLPALEDYIARVRRLYSIVPAAEGFIRRGGRWKSLSRVVIEPLQFKSAKTEENRQMPDVDLNKLDRLAAAAQKKDEQARELLRKALRAHPELLPLRGKEIPLPGRIRRLPGRQRRGGVLRRRRQAAPDGPGAERDGAGRIRMC